MPRTGTIVAWTITLGKPNATQIKFFNANEGGVAEAAIAILRAAAETEPDLQADRAEPAREARSRTSARPPSSRSKRTINVKKGDVVALTVPSWAPALALGFGNDTSWRASRPKSQCTSTSAQTAHTQVGTAVQYFCLYQTARLTYSATLISTP